MATCMRTRLLQTYGKASDHLCNGCDKTASLWVCTPHSDPRDVSNYEPLCRSCAKLYK
jgi:NifB/MoaA-like Fe-S oxidoreductase